MNAMKGRTALWLLALCCALGSACVSKREIRCEAGVYSLKIKDCVPIDGGAVDGVQTCQTAADCLNPAASACSEVGLCVACAATSDCKAAAAVCDTRAGVCVGCLGDADCQGSPGGPFCDAINKICVGCLSNADCRGSAVGPVCDPANRSCIGCMSNSDCRGSVGGPACDLTAKTCVGCVAGADCPTGKVCETPSHSCVGCRGNTDCDGTIASHLCDAATKTCVGCLAAGDCTGTRPVCEQTKACIACISDDLCAAKSTTTPRCATSGACVVCTDARRDCTASTPICGPDNVCHACARDSECAAAYGPNPGLCVSGRCVDDSEVVYLQGDWPRCSTSAGNGSAATPYCYSSDATALLTARKHVLIIRGPDRVRSLALPELNPLLVVGQNAAKVEVLSSTDAALVSVIGGDVTIRDLQIDGNTTGPGVLATGGVIRMTRCQILWNQSGIVLQGAGFDITNTLVAANRGASAFSVLIGETSNQPTRFAFNTVTDNMGLGVGCQVPYVLQSVLIAGNGGTDVGSMCTLDTTSSTAPPMFDRSRAYHLGPTSPCVDKGGNSNRNTDVPSDDIDGEPRPQGITADCGADEYRPVGTTN